MHIDTENHLLLAVDPSQSVSPYKNVQNKTFTPLTARLALSSTLPGSTLMQQIDIMSATTVHCPNSVYQQPQTIFEDANCQILKECV